MANVSRRQFLGLGSVALGGMALAACSSDGGSTSTEESTSTDSSASTSTASGDVPTIRLGTTNDGHIFYAIAKEKGYLEEEGVNIEPNVFQNSDDAFQALFSGKVDLLSNSGTNLPLVHIASGQDLVIYAGYMLTGCMPVIAKAGTVWNGVDDLLGKTIACSGNEYAVFGPLYDEGHTMDEVTTIVLSNHSDRVEAVRSGKADYAICGTSQNYNISQTPEVEVMCYCSDITPNYSCCRVESTSQFLDANQDAVQSMLRAWLRAQCWFEKNRDAAADIVAKEFGNERDQYSAYITNDHFQPNVDPYKSSVERAWNWMSEMGLFPDGYESINVDDHINTDIYKAALDKVVEEHQSEDPEFYDKMVETYNTYDA